MPEPDGGLCKRPKWVVAIEVIVVIVVVVSIAWRIAPQVGGWIQTINDVPQAIENMKNTQNLDWAEFQRITDACDCTKANSTYCLDKSKSLSGYTSCEDQQCPGCFFTGPYLPVVNDTCNASGSVVFDCGGGCAGHPLPS